MASALVDRADTCELSEPCDRELIHRFLNHQDERAFALLVDRHGPMVLGVCRRQLRSEHDVEDAFQATFLVLTDKLSGLRWQRSIANWIYAVAYRVARKSASRIHRRREMELGSSDELEDHGFRDVSTRHVAQLLDHELSQLPAKYRLPLVLCYLEGKTRQQAAQQLGCSDGVLKGRLERARRRLRLRLAMRGLTFSSVVGLPILCPATNATSLAPTLLESTVEAVLAFRSSGQFGDTLSQQTVELVQGEARMMATLVQPKYAALTILMASMFGFGAVATTGHVHPSQAVPEHQFDVRLDLPLEAEEQVALVVAPANGTFQANEQADSGENILRNAGAEQGNGTPAHWSQGANINGVEYVWDTNQGKQGKASLSLQKSANRYFPIAQWYQIVERKSDRAAIEVSAQVKAENASKAIIDVIFLDGSGEWVSHEWASYIGAKQAGDPPANHDWREYKGKVKIPAGTTKVQIGLQIYGPGKVWFDNISAKYTD